VSYQENDILACALSYAERGWAIHPVHSAPDGRCTCGKADCTSSAKHPRTAHSVKDATQDPDTIREWWKRWTDANVAGATGEVSGFDVLDVDPRNEGDVTLAALQEEYGNLPHTVSQSTGGGGLHFLFKHVDGIPSGAERGGPGLDWKSNGGYIVLAPSKHASGQPYRWEHGHAPWAVEIAEAPSWLLAQLPQF
jgi:hypothetical protein